MTRSAHIRTATPQDALLLTRLHDQARHDWPDFSTESPAGVASAISDDGMVYLLLEERAAVCLHADTPHRYGFLDFPYAVPEDADALLKAALSALIGLRVECPLPAERVWEAEALIRHGFQVGRTQRRMVRADLGSVAAPTLPAGAERTDPTLDAVEALHDLVFTGHGKSAGWRTDPDNLPVIGLTIGGQLAGYALGANHGGFFWLSELAVHPEFRRRGLGRALTLLALAQLRGAGASQVHLYVNDDHDQHAPRLYEGAGFSTHRLTIRYIRENEREGRNQYRGSAFLSARSSASHSL